MRSKLLAVLCAVPAVCAAFPASAQAASAACQNALAAIDRLQEEAAAHPPASEKERAQLQARLKAGQAHAARACLGNSGASDRAAERLAIPPPADAAAAPLSPAAVLPPPNPALRPPTPVVVTPPRLPTVTTNCDPGGCWTSDGTRIQKMGPTMVGPKGVCTVVGGITTCPP